MKSYQLILIAVKGNGELATRVKDDVTGLSGKIDSSAEWGKRNFFYPIKKRRDGYYFEYHLSLPANQVLPLKRKLDNDASVLRYLLLLS